MDIKPEGKKHKVMKKIKELREEFEKEGKIIYEDAGLLDTNITDLKMIKSLSKVVKDKKTDLLLS